ncbi:MAG: hypothetical protein EWV50_16880 [Microcystis aeruginosa Ma_MB_F_20061100_S20]|uniref:DUF6883 domain-containing protein n=1 Tax=Microcystis aeruginosa Ma_MB_F_20061100_S20D TaxID=2486253 RepID=A0A552EK83_MICAE|nr:MAG: hypothetical protein EWV78_12655 [Microcystis aeruginosa Ma_MB_F_20061100_S20D]TRU35409.1 MAG: hypothetical protein EWV50_16880 [Microcystis aeruginosa Ma_MB_F_20061100_S20]
MSEVKLPHPESTIIDDHKLTGYSLNLNHADGRHKARVFKSALNLDKYLSKINYTSKLSAVSLLLM